MINTSKYFCTYISGPNNKNIITANGSINTIADKGDIKLNPTSILKNVLHVFKLCTNIVSISKLLQDLSYTIITNSSYCDFQN